MIGSIYKAKSNNTFLLITKINDDTTLEAYLVENGKGSDITIRTVSGLVKVGLDSITDIVTKHLLINRKNRIDFSEE